MTHNTDNSSWAYGILTECDVHQLESWDYAFRASLQQIAAEKIRVYRAKQARREK